MDRRLIAWLVAGAIAAGVAYWITRPAPERESECGNFRAHYQSLEECEAAAKR